MDHTDYFEQRVLALDQQTRNTEFQGFQATHSSSLSHCKTCLASESGEQIRTGAVGVSCRVREEHCQVLGMTPRVCVLTSPNYRLPCYDPAEPRRNVLLFSPKFGVGATSWDQQRRCLWGVGGPCTPGMSACFL